MSTQKAPSGGQGRISVEDPRQLRDWSRRFAVTEAELLAAVRAAGDQAGDVEAHLRKQKKLGHMDDDRAFGRL